MLRITPHPAFVSRVTARRGPLDFAPPLPTYKPDATWAHFKQMFAGQHLYKRVQKEEVAQAAAAMAKSGKLADDLRTVAVAERLMWHYAVEEPNTLVRIVASELGVAKMVEMKLTSGAIGIFEKEARLAFDEGEPGTTDPSWGIARAIVCRADDASYAAARDFAASWRESRPIAARIFADYLFPSEVAWANADLAELVPIAKSAPFNLSNRGRLLLTVSNDVTHARGLLDQLSEWELWSFIGDHACNLALALAPNDALSVLCTLLERSKRAGKQQLATLGAAMCALEGEEMAAELAGLLLHAPIGPLAVDYFKRFPDLARSALPKVAQGSSKAADAARSILAASASKDDVPIADANEVPRVLREMPWKKRKKPKPVTLDVVPPVPATTLEWKPGERENALTKGAGWYQTQAQDLEDMTAGVLQEWEKLPRGRPVDIWVRWGRERGNFRVPDRLSLQEWNTNNAATAYFGPLRMLAVHGDAALPGLFAREAFVTSWNNEAVFEAQLHAVGKESALIAAHALSARKAWKNRAREWLVEHADIAAAVLFPIALGEESTRKEAERALRLIARTRRDALESVAKVLGGDAERAAMELVDRDPLTDLEVKGKLPPFVRVPELPIVKTKSGKRLPDDAVGTLVEILRSTTPDAPYAGLDEIRDALDDASLGELAWALVQSWILAGAKGTYEWVPLTLALIGDDACARRLAPYVRDWARKDAKKAKLASDVLAAMGTPTALLHLSYIADKSRFEEAKKHARETLERVASAQGLTTDELADRTVPDLELDEGGTTTLDYGPRKFTVTFDEGLRPVLQGEDGGRLPSFPRGTKTDDAALVKLASARFKGLKADAESVAQALLRRFENAMVRGRAWSADSFRAHVMGHPLVTHVARRLVWKTSAGAFRVAEDGSLASENDAEYTLSADAKVTLPHPLVLGAEAVAAWARILGDYGVVQPFEQLGRATHVATGEDAKATKLERFANRKSKPGPLMGSLDSHGWQKWPDETSLASCGKTVRTKLGGEAHVTMYFQPGIELSNVAGSPEQIFQAPQLAGATSFGDIDPIDYSELVRDLELLAH